MAEGNRGHAFLKTADLRFADGACHGLGPDEGLLLVHDLRDFLFGGHCAVAHLDGSEDGFREEHSVRYCFVERALELVLTYCNDYFR